MKIIFKYKKAGSHEKSGENLQKTVHKLIYEGKTIICQVDKEARRLLEKGEKYAISRGLREHGVF